MKNIVLLLFGLLLFSGLNAQSYLGRGDNLKFEQGEVYGYAWGETTDTLRQSDTLQITFRVKGEALQSIKLALYVTKVSGTVTSKFYIRGSMDKVNYVLVDSITLTNVSTGLASASPQLASWNYPYIQVRAITTATAQKAWYKLFVSKRDM